MCTNTTVSSAVEFFSRHLVALTVAVEGDDDHDLVDGHTGFVMEVKGVWFLVTAGHILRELEKEVLGGSRKVRSWGLLDDWAARGLRFWVPFDFANAPRFWLDDDDAHDIAFVAIDPMTRRALEARNVVAVGTEAWGKVPAEPIAHFVVGLPAQFTRRIPLSNKRTGLQLDPVIIPIAECEAPEHMRDKARFYGRVGTPLKDASGEVLTNLNGMSGGPIFAVRRAANGQAYYHLVSVQGSWLPSLGIITGTYTLGIGKFLEQRLSVAA